VSNLHHHVPSHSSDVMWKCRTELNVNRTRQPDFFPERFYRHDNFASCDIPQ
jgi:hypothetical protein